MKVSQKDKYAPKKTGVYDVHLQALDTKNKAQQWSYDDRTRALHPLLFPQKALFESFNKNLIVYDFRGMKNQKFAYDMGREAWLNEVT